MKASDTTVSKAVARSECRTRNTLGGKAKDMLNTTTDKYQEGRNSLPDDLRPVFDALVEEYYFHSTVHYGKGYVAYKVLAALVKAGWRCSKSEEEKRSERR